MRVLNVIVPMVSKMWDSSRNMVTHLLLGAFPELEAGLRLVLVTVYLLKAI